MALVRFVFFRVTQDIGILVTLHPFVFYPFCTNWGPVITGADYNKTREPSNYVASSPVEGGHAGQQGKGKLFRYNSRTSRRYVCSPRGIAGVQFWESSIQILIQA